MQDTRPAGFPAPSAIHPGSFWGLGLAGQWWVVSRPQATTSALSQTPPDAWALAKPTTDSSPPQPCPAPGRPAGVLGVVPQRAWPSEGPRVIGTRRPCPVTVNGGQENLFSNRLLAPNQVWESKKSLHLPLSTSFLFPKGRIPGSIFPVCLPEGSPQLGAGAPSEGSGRRAPEWPAILPQRHPGAVSWSVPRNRLWGLEVPWGCRPLAFTPSLWVKWSGSLRQRGRRGLLAGRQWPGWQGPPGGRAGLLHPASVPTPGAPILGHARPLPHGPPRPGLTPFLCPPFSSWLPRHAVPGVLAPWLIHGMNNCEGHMLPKVERTSPDGHLGQCGHSVGRCVFRSQPRPAPPQQGSLGRTCVAWLPWPPGAPLTRPPCLQAAGASLRGR